MDPRKKQTPLTFGQAKAKEMAKLRGLLKRRSWLGISYPVRNALPAVNALPFAYTIKSLHPQFGKHKGRGVRFSEAAEMHKVVFYPGFIDFRLNLSHPMSEHFISALGEWQQKNFPKARVLQHARTGVTKIGIDFQSAKSKLGFIHGSQAASHLGEARRFVKELADWVKKYRATMRIKRDYLRRTTPKQWRALGALPCLPLRAGFALQLQLKTSS